MKANLQELAGIHTLTSIGRATWEEGFVLELDGKKYILYEDECDEYRSCVAIQLIGEGEYPKEVFFPILDQKVEITIGRDGDFGEHTIESFEMKEVKNGQTILSAFSKDWDDWYPYVEFTYSPENLSVNIENSIKKS